MENQDNLISYMADLKEDDVLKTVRKRLDLGTPPLQIIDYCHKGIVKVGERYEKGTYYISGLIMAGEIMKSVGEIVLPLMQEDTSDTDTGSLILLGTAEGDIHFIGKDIFKVLAECNGFRVQDLGVDVSPEKFLDAVHDSNPDIIGISCLITHGYRTMRDTISYLRKKIPPEFAPEAYIIGGVLDEQVFEFIGADYWADDAMKGVRICQRIIDESSDKSDSLHSDFWL